MTAMHRDMTPEQIIVLKETNDQTHGPGNWCFSATARSSGIYGLGIVVKDEPGYYPVPLQLAFYVTMESAWKAADYANGYVDIALARATSIIASSMRRSHESTGRLPWS